MHANPLLFVDDGDFELGMAQQQLARRAQAKDAGPDHRHVKHHDTEPTMPSMIKHLVLFKRKPDYDKTAYDEMLAGFRSIQGKIPSVKNMSIGEDFSHRGVFDLALSCEFETEEELRAYGQHAEHQRLIHDVMPQVVEAQREVVDYHY